MLENPTRLQTNISILSRSGCMAELELESEIILEDDGETIRVRNIVIRDGHGHSLLGAQDETERGDTVRRALRLGLFAITRLALGANVYYVEKEFGNLLRELDLRLDPDIKNSHFAKLHDLIEDYFEEGGTLEQLFSPLNEKGPLGIMQREIKEQIQDIRDLLVKKETKEEIWELTALKGADFEDACEDILENIVSDWLGGELDRTTNIEGVIKGSRSGDFVMTLRDSADRIVIEVKDWKRVSLPKIQEELDKAMKNRQAKYAIFVSKYRESLPDKVGWFNEYKKNKLVCALGSREADTVFPGMLWVTCQWAKLRLLEIQGRVEKFDAGKVSRYLEEVNTHLEKLQGIHAKCDTADEALEEIRKIARDVEREVRERLKDTALELGIGTGAVS